MTKNNKKKFTGIFFDTREQGVGIVGVTRVAGVAGVAGAFGTLGILGTLGFPIQSYYLL